MKKNIFTIFFASAFALMAGYVVYASQQEVEMSDLAIANVEALASGESGADCPNGCSAIGWGTTKILECDCNYDHFSSCDRWGC